MKKVGNVLATILLLLLSSSVLAGSMTLKWKAPTENDDGSLLTDLRGYKVYYGPASGNYTKVLNLNNPALTAYILDNLTPGTYYSVLTAYNSKDVESVNSNEVSKVVVDEPQGLTVVDGKVYTVVKINNGFLTTKVGVVPSGTACIPDQTVNGLFAVDTAFVQWDEGVDIEPHVVVAVCQ